MALLNCCWWHIAPKTLPVRLWAVTPGEKKVQLTPIGRLRKSTTSFPMSLRWTVFVALKSLKRAQKRKVTVIRPEFEQYAVTSKRFEIACQLVSITNRKSHTGFRLLPTSVTLNDLERRNSYYFALFHRIRYLWRPIKSTWLKIDLKCLQNISSSTFWQKLTYPAARSLCDS